MRSRPQGLVVFLGFALISFCILFYRNKGTTTHKARADTSTGSWRCPRHFHPKGILNGTKLNFSLANHTLTYEERKDRICGKDWQENYKKLHRDILQSRRPRRFIVFSCTEEGHKCAGYGNRIGGMTSLLFLSILTQRAFLIEWDQFSFPLENYLLPKGIEWNYSTKNLKDLDTRRQHWGSKYGVKKDFLTWLQQADPQEYLDHPVEKIMASWYFAENLWDNPILEKNARELGLINERLKSSFIGCAFDFLFQKSRELKTRLKAARRSLGLVSQIPKLGLHIRMGDVSFRRSSLRDNNIDYKAFFGCTQAIGEALARQRPGSIKRHVKWFLATDDNKVKQFALENYPLNAVTLNITPQHIKALKAKDSESTEGMLGVLMDHFLLSECDFLILSPSTFGKTAAELSFHSKGTIIHWRSKVRQTV